MDLDKLTSRNYLHHNSYVVTHTVIISSIAFFRIRDGINVEDLRCTFLYSSGKVFVE